MIIPQYYPLWLGSYYRLTPNNALEFEELSFIDNHIEVDIIVAWDLNEETKQMTPITTRQYVDSVERVSGIIGFKQQAVANRVLLEAKQHFRKMRAEAIAILLNAPEPTDRPDAPQP